MFYYIDIADIVQINLRLIMLAVKVIIGLVF